MCDSLRSLPTHELFSRTRAITAQRRKLTLSLFLHLNEIERRKAYLERGHASLYIYCTKELDFTPAAAMRRIQCANCIAQFPDAYQLLEANEINLSTLAQVSRILRPENSASVLARIRGKSQKEVEAIVAEQEPRAAVPHDRVRTIMIRVPAPSPVMQARDATSGQASTTTSAAACENSAYFRSGSEKEVESALPHLEKRLTLQFTVHPEFMAKLDKIKSLASHRLARSAQLEQVFGFLMYYFTEREDPAARQERREKRQEKPAQRPVKTMRPAARANPRAIPALLRDKVHVRDRQQCTYVAPNGQRCGSTHVLQVDHITPVARGGSATIDNLRLLCAYHNRLEAERLMGRPGPRGT